MAIDADRKGMLSKHLNDRRRAVDKRGWKPGLKQTKDDAALLFLQANPRCVTVSTPGALVPLTDVTSGQVHWHV